eukprot:587439-Rhodomonas_salina.1
MSVGACAHSSAGCAQPSRAPHAHAVPLRNTRTLASYAHAAPGVCVARYGRVVARTGGGEIGGGETGEGEGGGYRRGSSWAR